MGTLISIPTFGSARWQDPVASTGDLPSSGNTLGDARVVTDDDAIYLWNGSAWVNTAPGAAFTTFQTDTGTSPVATGTSDTLTLTSPVVDVNGNSSTDTVELGYIAEVDHGDMGTTETIDFANGPAHYGNISAGCTLTLSNPESGGAYTLLFEADGTNEITWPGTVDWGGTGAPDFSALTDGDLVLISLYYSGKKSKYYGTYKDDF